MKENQFVCPYVKERFDRFLRDDEISLYDIWVALNKKRFWIIVIALLFVGVALAMFLFFQRDPYSRAEVRIPSFADYHLEGVSNGNIGLRGIGPFFSGLSETVERKIRDEKFQSKFWEENGKKKIIESSLNTTLSEAWFLQNLSVKGSSLKRGNQDLVVILSGNENSHLLINLLSDFLLYVVESSCTELIENLKNDFKLNRYAVHVQMDALRKISNEEIEQKLKALNEQKIVIEKFEIGQKKRRLERLQTQKIIAEKFEIKRMRNSLDDLIKQKELAEKLGIFELSKEMEGSPLYIRGVKALTGEIDLLKRKIAEGIVVSDQLEKLQFDIEMLEKQIAEGIVSSGQLDKLQLEIDQLKIQKNRSHLNQVYFDLQEKLYLMDTIDFDKLKSSVAEMIWGYFDRYNPSVFSK